MKWRINHIIRENDMIAEVTIGEGFQAEVVVSMKIGILRGNDCTPQYKVLMEIFADGLRVAAEKRGLV